MSSSRKLTVADVEEGFAVMVERVRSGSCCIPGCENPAQLIIYARSDPPFLCDRHQDDGEETHTGEYIPTANPYYHKWTCCDSTWKKCMCGALSAKLRSLSDVPVTAAHFSRADEKDEEAKRRQEENERWERLMNRGQEESYDR